MKIRKHRGINFIKLLSDDNKDIEGLNFTVGSSQVSLKSVMYRAISNIYLLNHSTKNIIDNIKIKNELKPTDFDIFKNVKIKHCCILTPCNNLMVFNIIGDNKHIFFHNFNVLHTTFIQNNNFDFDPSKEQSYITKEIEYMYKLLCFFLLSDVDTVYLKPNNKVKTKQDGKTLNDTKSDITVVTSSWNIQSIRTEGFGVSGHFRVLVKNRKEPKLSYVKPYVKQGLIRKAKIESVN